MAAGNSAKADKSQERFYAALRDLFVGAPVEGQSGFINLMRIKSRYYTNGVFPKLQQDIEAALKPFPGFRQELFDKLYDFFHRYFSPSGSIYFQHTPAHKNIYEKVYTDDRDVVLFWKTHMLYYVKTDRLFNSLEVEVDDRKFFFDASTLEHKRANEKRELVYEFTGKREDGVLVFATAYSEKGRKTKLDGILRQLHKLGVEVKEETVERAFRVFERQSEVDYFINKNAKAFLREQFDLWMFQYVFSGESEWTEQRIKQLQVLKDIALKVIDFISQFEDELVRIWNKPKFVLNSNYVITLDRIAAKDIALVERLLKHEGMKAQIQEWRDLGIVGNDFRKTQILESKLHGEVPVKQWRFLPFDTKHFKDLELEILGLFDHLDDELDGWLIKSESYQALKTLEPRLAEQVRAIYIDPPFNIGEEADYHYSVGYGDTTWLTLLENRLLLAKALLRLDGSIMVRCNHDGNMLVRLLMGGIFEKENYRNEIIVRRAEVTKGDLAKQFASMRSVMVNYDNIYWFSRSPETRFAKVTKPVAKERAKAHWHSFWKAEDRPNMRYELLGVDLRKEGYGQWMWEKDRATAAVENYRRYEKEAKRTKETIEAYWTRTGEKLEFVRREGEGTFSIKYWIPPREFVLADNNWLDIKGYANQWDFKTENSEPLLRRSIEAMSKPRELVVDHFLGSGTTCATAHKLSRRWVGVEMGEHFHSVVLRRMKLVVSGEQTGVSRDVEWKGGGFFKYYELEQYEDCLRRAKYEDADLFDDPNQDPYNQYVFLRDPKLLDAVKVDTEKNKVQVDLSRLYKGIDLPETLSNLTGKRIRRIGPDSVEFEDGTVIDLTKQDFEFFKMIKPMVWW